MTPKPSWVDGRLDALLAALHELGMSASRTPGTALIGSQTSWRVAVRRTPRPPRSGPTADGPPSIRSDLVAEATARGRQLLHCEDDRRQGSIAYRCSERRRIYGGQVLRRPAAPGGRQGRALARPGPMI